MVRASGSYPEGHKFESHRRYHDNNTEQSGLHRKRASAVRPVGQAVKTPPFHGGNMGSSPVRVTSKFLNRTSFGLGFLLFGVRTGMVKNPSVRARSFALQNDDALRGFPFKGVGVSREKVRFTSFKQKAQVFTCAFCCLITLDLQIDNTH